MALPTEWHTQLWATIQQLQIDNGVDVVKEEQTSSAPFTVSTFSSDDQNLQNLQTFYPTLNYSTGNFDTMEFELGCVNKQSVLSHLITMILYSIVCLAGLFGNTMVIYVVLRFSKMQTVTNIYILNLAIADECFLIGIPFLLYTMQKQSWQFGQYACKAYMVSTSITQFTSSIFLLIMAADRYIAVCHPISSPRYRTPFVSKIVSCLAWLTSALFMLPVILFANSIEIDDHVSCNIKWPDGHNGKTDSTFIWYTLSLGFVTPLTFILAFYSLVIRKLHSVELKHKSKEKKRSHRKVTKLVLTVIAVYIFCWTPYWISQLVLINTKVARCPSSFEILAHLMVGCLCYSNSAMNPLLYAFLSDNFKKSFLRAFSCAGKRRDRLTGDQQAERSILPKWGKRDNSRCDEANLSGEPGVESCGNSSNYSKQNKRYNSNPSNFLGTSTAGGTGMTATSIVEDANSDLTPMAALGILQNELTAESSEDIGSHEKSSYGNFDETILNNPYPNLNRLRPPVLQTDL